MKRSPWVSPRTAPRGAKSLNDHHADGGKEAELREVAKVWFEVTPVSSLGVRGQPLVWGR